jgi:hypothetical protein
MKELREYVRLAIAEAAVTPKEARGQGLALFIKEEKSYVYFCLYDPAGLLDAISEGKTKGILSHVYGMLTLTKTSGTGKSPWESPMGAVPVTRSAAQGGYGPMMYDIAMSHYGTIYADRGSVTSDAKGIWQFYKDNRSDVKAFPVDDVDNPKTPSKEDDGHVKPGGKKNPLNYVYSTNSRIGIGTLQQRHEKYAAEIVSAAGGKSSAKSVDAWFVELARKFFDSKY